MKVSLAIAWMLVAASVAASGDVEPAPDGLGQEARAKAGKSKGGKTGFTGNKGGKSGTDAPAGPGETGRSKGGKSGTDTPTSPGETSRSKGGKSKGGKSGNISKTGKSKGGKSGDTTAPPSAPPPNPGPSPRPSVAVSAAPSAAVPRPDGAMCNAASQCASLRCVLSACSSGRVGQTCTAADACVASLVCLQSKCTTSSEPSPRPSPLPSVAASAAPSSGPSTKPSPQSSLQPSDRPSASLHPTHHGPSGAPSASPTVTPSKSPSTKPSVSPSVSPSSAPSDVPTGSPSASSRPSHHGPSSAPSLQPSSSPTVCKAAANVCFSIDMSSTISADEQALERQFATDIVNKLSDPMFGVNNKKYSVVYFGNGGLIQTNDGAPGVVNATEAETALTTASSTLGLTSHQAAINVCDESLVPAGTDEPHFIVLITDGIPSIWDPSSPCGTSADKPPNAMDCGLAAAAAAKARGTIIETVFVETGSNATQQYMRDLSSDGDFWGVGNFNQLANVVNDIALGIACQAAATG